MFLNLQDPFIRLTGCHPRQTGGTSTLLFAEGTITVQLSRDVPCENLAPGPRQGGKNSRGGPLIYPVHATYKISRLSINGS